MQWWGWLLLAWAVVGAGAAFWIGAAAARARSRERAARKHQYSDAIKQEWQEAS